MIGTHPHHPMVVSIAGKELRQALITIISPKTERKGITSLDIRIFISITILLLMMDINQCIKKHVLFLDYITMHLLSAGKE